MNIGVKMKKVIYGVDPDSKAHGFATYVDGELHCLECLPLMSLVNRIKNDIYDYGVENIEIHIEDLNANSSSAFHIKKSDPPAVKQKKSEGVGRCKQAQIEVERVAEHFGIKIARHKVSKMWKSQEGKKQFELVTGWKGRSNEDTRSAAYFGWLGVTA